MHMLAAFDISHGCSTRDENNGKSILSFSIAKKKFGDQLYLRHSFNTYPIVIRACLQYVYMPLLRKELQEFVEEHNSH